MNGIVKGRYSQGTPAAAVLLGRLRAARGQRGLGVGLGTGSLTAINMTFRNITIVNTNTGSSGGPVLHFKAHRTTQSGYATGILFENIRLSDVGKVIDVSNYDQDESMGDNTPRQGGGATAAVTERGG